MTRTMIPAADPEVRRTGIGGSDASAVLGVSRWKTPLQLYLEKTGLVDGRIAENEAMEWGVILEPTVLEQYAVRSAQVVTGRNLDGEVVAWSPEGTLMDPPTDAVSLMGTLRHDSHPHMMCHLDGVATDIVTDEVVGIIEAKTSLSKYLPKDYWGDEDSDHVPEDYICQTQHQGAIVASILRHTVPIAVPVLRAGPEWAVYHLEIDPEFTQMLIQREAEFWDRVQLLDPPDPQAGDADKKALAQLYPLHEDIPPIEVAPDEVLHSTADLLNSLKETKRNIDTQIKDCENQLKFKMQEHPNMVGPGWKATWKTAKGRTKIDYPETLRALSEKHGIPMEDISVAIAEHTHIGDPSRRFRFTWSD